VQEASKLFTLSDVLPSSLNNSERSIQVRRASTENNQESDKENDNDDVMKSSYTGRDKSNQNDELSNANVEDSLNRHPGNPNSMY